VASVAPVASPDIRDLVQVGLAAERAGWSREAAFDAAIYLRCHGTPVPDAVEMFMHAARWQQ
jgi:hypothetical protein